MAEETELECCGALLAQAIAQQERGDEQQAVEILEQAAVLVTETPSLKHGRPWCRDASDMGSWPSLEVGCYAVRMALHCIQVYRDLDLLVTAPLSTPDLATPANRLAAIDRLSDHHFALLSFTPPPCFAELHEIARTATAPWTEQHDALSAEAVRAATSDRITRLATYTDRVLRDVSARYGVVAMRCFSHDPGGSSGVDSLAI